jgi:excinuclease ABC subunit C
VASAVVFVNGEPDKSQYRRLRIKGEWGNDDYASMHEVVARYFRRRLEEGKPLPDLVVIDGGKGQLGAARAALESLELAQVAVISLAKRDEEVFLPGRPTGSGSRGGPVRCGSFRGCATRRTGSPITYNRKLRTRRTIQSEISSIPGVGAARQQALLERFGSMRALSTRRSEEIAPCRASAALSPRASFDTCVRDRRRSGLISQHPKRGSV